MSERELWNDEQLTQELERATDYTVARVKCLSHAAAHTLLRAMRDDMQRRIDELEAERDALAAQQRWEPEELAFAVGAATIGQIGDQMFVDLYGETLQVDLPDNIRLCRRQGGNDAQ